LLSSLRRRWRGFTRMQEKLKRILGVGTFIEGMQAGLLDATAILSLRGTVGEISRRAVFGRLSHARGIVNRASDAFEARLRIAVIDPRRAGRIGIARVLASLAATGDAIEIAQVGENAGAI
jgi:hypothetical protein